MKHFDWKTILQKQSNFENVSKRALMRCKAEGNWRWNVDRTLSVVSPVRPYPVRTRVGGGLDSLNVKWSFSFYFESTSSFNTPFSLSIFIVVFITIQLASPCALRHATYIQKSRNLSHSVILNGKDFLHEHIFKLEWVWFQSRACSCST